MTSINVRPKSAGGASWQVRRVHSHKRTASFPTTGIDPGRNSTSTFEGSSDCESIFDSTLDARGRSSSTSAALPCMTTSYLAYYSGSLYDTFHAAPPRSPAPSVKSTASRTTLRRLRSKSVKDSVPSDPTTPTASTPVAPMSSRSRATAEPWGPKVEQVPAQETVDPFLYGPEDSPSPVPRRRTWFKRRSAVLEGKERRRTTSTSISSTSSWTSPPPLPIPPVPPVPRKIKGSSTAERSQIALPSTTVGHSSYSSSSSAEPSSCPSLLRSPSRSTSATSGGDDASVLFAQSQHSTASIGSAKRPSVWESRRPAWLQLTPSKFGEHLGRERLGLGSGTDCHEQGGLGTPVPEQAPSAPAQFECEWLANDSEDKDQDQGTPFNPYAWSSPRFHNGNGNGNAGGSRSPDSVLRVEAWGSVGTVSKDSLLLAAEAAGTGTGTSPMSNFSQSTGNLHLSSASTTGASVSAVPNTSTNDSNTNSNINSNINSNSSTTYQPQHQHPHSHSLSRSSISSLSSASAGWSGRRPDTQLVRECLALGSSRSILSRTASWTTDPEVLGLAPTSAVAATAAPPAVASGAARGPSPAPGLTPGAATGHGYGYAYVRAHAFGHPSPDGSSLSLASPRPSDDRSNSYSISSNSPSPVRAPASGDTNAGPNANAPTGPGVNAGTVGLTDGTTKAGARKRSFSPFWGRRAVVERMNSTSPAVPPTPASMSTSAFMSTSTSALEQAPSSSLPSNTKVREGSYTGRLPWERMDEMRARPWTERDEAEEISAEGHANANNGNNSPSFSTRSRSRSYSRPLKSFQRRAPTSSAPAPGPAGIDTRFSPVCYTRTNPNPNPNPNPSSSARRGTSPSASADLRSYIQMQHGGTGFGHGGALGLDLGSVGGGANGIVMGMGRELGMGMGMGMGIAREMMGGETERGITKSQYQNESKGKDVGKERKTNGLVRAWVRLFK